MHTVVVAGAGHTVVRQHEQEALVKHRLAGTRHGGPMQALGVVVHVQGESGTGQRGIVVDQRVLNEGAAGDDVDVDVLACRRECCEG